MDSYRAKLNYVLKHNLIIQNLYIIIMSALFKFIGLFLSINNKMVLFNAHGRKYNDSPKAIFLEMINDPFFKDFEFVWALDNPENYDIPNCTTVRMDSFKYFLTALKSKYWISCVNIERGLKFKKDSTVYLNTWHGTPLKYVGNAVQGRNDFDFSNIDFFCSAGIYEKEIYIEDFKVSEKSIINTGLPRNDNLYKINNSRNETIKKKINIPVNKKVILYAPTWRDSVNNGLSYDLNPPLDFDLLQKTLGEEYVILLRTHSYTNKTLKMKYNNFLINVSQYPEINELMMISDILVSDYSAIIFDFSILEKPILCFGYDYELYKHYRGLYLDLVQELPNGVINDQEQLVRNILNMDYNLERKKTRDFKMKYLEFGGCATEICISKMFKSNK